MKNNLTEYAVKAYKTRQETGYTHNPHLYSSPAWYAHELGIYFDTTGRTEPKNVRMGRGYSINANDMLFKINESDVEITFERIK